MATYVEEPPLSYTEMFFGYTNPGALMFAGFKFTMKTFLEDPLLTFKDFDKFRHKAFAKLWLSNGKAMSEEMPGNTIELIASSSGVLLDIGPGTGETACHLKPSQISKVYAVEPAVDMHEQLAANYDKAGLKDKYAIIAAGAEPAALIPALAKDGVILQDSKGAKPIFDTILSVRVLCGIPHQEETVQELYDLLKPGGRFLVCEHIRHGWPRPQQIIGALFQKIYVLLGWKFWLGGCALNKDTISALQKAGGGNGWEKFDLKLVGGWLPVPFVVGELVKKR